MAKLTAEQKEENKVARRLREKAFKERRAAYEAAKEAAVSAVRNGPLASEFNAALEAFDNLTLRVQDEERRIDEQIFQLQAERAALREKFGHSAANDLRKKTNEAYYSALHAAERAVDQQFPDVAGVYSAATWEAKGGYTPPADAT